MGSKEAETGYLDAKDVIPEIWKHISAQMPGVTIEQAFGKVPPAYLADKHWALSRAIAHCHSMLNIVGYEPDLGLSNETKMANILSDAAHIANAAYCDGLVTGDKPMAAKARVIYAFLGVGTLVATLEEAKHSGPSKRKARP